MDLKLLERDPECVKLVQREINRDATLRFNVLVADDEEFDRLLACLGFLDSPCLHVVGEAWNGEEVIDYLRGDGKYADRARHPFPDLLLLDLHMPRVNGLEVLEWIQEHPLKDLRVVVLSGSLSPALKTRVMELGAHCFAEKCGRASQMTELIRRLEIFMVCHHKCPRVLNCAIDTAANQVKHFGRCVTWLMAGLASFVETIDFAT